MITKAELVDTYLKHRGLVRREKNENFSHILPFFMLDIMYSHLCTVIRPEKPKHKAKKVLSEWAMVYTKFNRDFFFCYSRDQWDDIIDLMDRFEAHTKNEVEAVKCRIESLLPENLPIKKQVVSSCMLCNIMVQSAISVWGKCYGKKNGQPEDRPELQLMRKKAMEFVNLYYRPMERFNCNNDPDVEKGVNELCHKMVSFLNIDFNA